MRLTKTEQDTIKQCLLEIDPDAQVYVFGSRVDDAKRGGDIDLLIDSKQLDMKNIAAYRWKLMEKLGEQKIDVVVISENRLPKQLQLLDKATQWLKRSLDQCAVFETKEKGLTEAQFDQLEALASRYSRVVDLLINKVFRAIDTVELIEPGSLIDTVNRAAKRELITVEQARLMKELRNRIVHEYEVEDLSVLLVDIMALSRTLLGVIAKTVSYGEKLIG